MRPSGANIRGVEQYDLAELSELEIVGATEPVSLTQLRRWYDLSHCERRRRGRRLWAVMRVAVVRGEVLGHAVLIGEDATASVRVLVHPRHRGEGLGREVLISALWAGFNWNGLAVAEWIVHERDPLTIDFARQFGFLARKEQPLIPGWFGPHNDGIVFCLNCRAEMRRFASG